jgi:hypothetical protein
MRTYDVDDDDVPTRSQSAIGNHCSGRERQAGTTSTHTVGARGLLYAYVSRYILPALWLALHSTAAA